MQTHDSRIFSDVGGFLVQDDKMNIAFLRAVNISKGVRIATSLDRIGLVDNIDIENFIRVFSVYAKEFYQRFIEKKKIVASITYEI